MIYDLSQISLNEFVYYIKMRVQRLPKNESKIIFLVAEKGTQLKQRENILEYSGQTNSVLADIKLTRLSNNPSSDLWLVPTKDHRPRTPNPCIWS